MQSKADLAKAARAKARAEKQKAAALARKRRGTGTKTGAKRPANTKRTPNAKRPIGKAPLHDLTDVKIKPTSEMFRTFQKAFDHFNRVFWRGELPSVMLAFQRNPKMQGHFRPSAWAQATGPNLSHEIVLNPDHLKLGDQEAGQTILHEMVHLWQHVKGRHVPRKPYHNHEWAKEMLRVGLTPCRSGKEPAPGANPEPLVGQKMREYATPNGAFLGEYKKLKALSWGFDWHGVPMPDKPKRPTRQGKRVKYTCPRTELTAWGRGGMTLIALDPEQFPTDAKLLAVLKRGGVVAMEQQIPEGYGSADDDESDD